MNADIQLEVKELEVNYRRVITAVQGISISVPRSSFTAMIGSNGAGKTTTLRAITGFLPADNARVAKGEIRFEKHNLNDMPPHEIYGFGVILVPERDKVFETLTVQENLTVVPKKGQSTSKRREREQLVYELFLPIARAKNRVAGYLSGGERQMLAIGRALVADPRILLIDELSQGLSPLLAQSLMDVLRVTINREQGITILLVEQNATMALTVSDYVYIVENGVIVLDGTPEKLLKSEDVQQFYLGHSDSGDRKSYSDIKQYRRKRQWYG